jgi:gliding motility-associated-like protein
MKPFSCRHLLILAWMLASISLTAQITSTFNADAESWTAPNASGGVTYLTTGGNPGGRIAGSPFFFVLGATTIYYPFYFVAPAAYRGNRSAYYNGTLQYDIQVSSAAASNQYAEVSIGNSLVDTLYYFPTVTNAPTTAWTPYSVVFNNALGFWKTSNSPTGAIATEALIQSVLANLTGLEIRGLYRDSNTANRLDNVSLRPPIIITTQPTSVAICNGITTSLTTAATNNPTISYQWQRETSPSVWGNVTNGGGYGGATTVTLSINTTGNFGAGNYRCQISGTAVADAFTNTAVVTVNSLPTAPTTTGNFACSSAAITLNAAGGAAGQYRWYTVPTGGTAIAGQTNSAYTTPVITGTTTYYVSINNGTCESTRTSVVATINTPPVVPTTTGNSACGSSAVTINAAGAAAGQYRWYTVPTGGTAIAGQTNSAYTTPVITGTTTYYVSINNGTCESTRTSVVATINTPPVAPTTTGNSACGSSAVTINAAGAAAGQYRWYTVPTGGTAIAGQTNSAYTTPVITGTTTYYVSINNGTCESTRTSVVAIINNLPTAPATTGGSACGPISITLNASGGTAGQYRWYTVPTGGAAITGETNSMYQTPIISTTTNYYVSINDGTCESTRTAVTATILTTGCNTIPPTISPVPLTTIVAGKITLDLVPLIVAPGVLNVNNITIVTPPSSGASASISNGILTINYAGKAFTGTESIVIRACDESSLCTEQTFTIEVAGDVKVYNGMSPNNDKKNEIFFIQYIDVIPGMAKNTVSIYNRWGSAVFEITDYNNTTRVFKGLGNNGEELPSGTYFYKIAFEKLEGRTGYLVLKR